MGVVREVVAHANSMRGIVPASQPVIDPHRGGSLQPVPDFRSHGASRILPVPATCPARPASNPPTGTPTGTFPRPPAHHSWMHLLRVGIIRGRCRSCGLGSGQMMTAWTTWTGCVGRMVSSVRGARGLVIGRSHPACTGAATAGAGPVWIAGTVFHRTRTPLTVWFEAAW